MFWKKQNKGLKPQAFKLNFACSPPLPLFKRTQEMNENKNENTVLYHSKVILKKTQMSVLWDPVLLINVSSRPLKQLEHRTVPWWGELWSQAWAQSSACHLAVRPRASHLPEPKLPSA